MMIYDETTEENTFENQQPDHTRTSAYHREYQGRPTHDNLRTCHSIEVIFSAIEVNIKGQRLK